VDVLNFFNQYFDDDFERIFDQYLYFSNIPTLEISKKEGQVRYRWQSDVDGFNMPIDVKIGDQKIRLYPKNNWQTIVTAGDLSVLEEFFYINVKEV
jgi:hypothetical protein